MHVPRLKMLLEKESNVSSSAEGLDDLLQGLQRGLQEMGFGGSPGGK